MWAKCKHVVLWTVGVLLALCSAVWFFLGKSNPTHEAELDAERKRIALERAVWSAAKKNKELNARLDQEVEDARSRGTLADRFNR